MAVDIQQTCTFSDRAVAIALRTYHRPLSEDNEDNMLESWGQVVDRIISHQKWLWERQLNHGLNDTQLSELDELKQLITDRRVLCAGRVMWLGGTKLSKVRESSMFNCAYTHLESVFDLVDILWLLLQGCGVGFRPIPGTLNGFRRPLESIQVIRSDRTKADGDPNNRETFDADTGVWTIRVGDSAIAWSKSIGKLIAGKYPAKKLILDFSQVRPGGTRLKSYGWISSGDSQISVAYEAIAKIMSNRADQLLSRIDMLDIVNWLGTILSSRRSAQICLFEWKQPEWEDFARCKHNWWLHGHIQRAQSNNSLIIQNKPTRQELEHLFKIMVESGGSEPGFVNQTEAQKRAPWFAGLNPCITKDSLILTDRGLLPVSDLVGRQFNVLLNGGTYRSTRHGFFYTGTRDIYRLVLENGCEIKATRDHMFWTTRGWQEVGQLTVSDEVYLSRNDCNYDNSFTYEYINQLRDVFDSHGIISSLGSDVSIILYLQASASTLVDIHLKLLSIGIMCHLNKNRREITIRGYAVVLFRTLIGFYNQQWMRRLTYLINKHRLYSVSSPVSSKVKLIENMNMAESVYDCTIHEAHCFSANGMIAHNCAEVFLPNKGFCNLTEVNLCAFKNKKNTLNRALYLVGRMNYRQTLVNLKDEILQEAWHLNNQFYRLCGVGLTGIVARPELTHYDYKSMKNMAISGAYSMALELGTSLPKNVTLVKPSGSLSKIMGTNEYGEIPEGIHKPLGRYIFNYVGFPKTDPLVQRFIDADYDVMVKPNEPSTMLIKFPVKYDGIHFSKKTVTRKDGKVEEVELNDDSAIDQLNRYLMIQNSWAEQNTSCTISYDREEIPSIIDWLLNNWNRGYVGTAFIFRFDPSKNAVDLGYQYLPQETVCKSTYDEYVAKLKPVDYYGIISSVELPDISECASGACPMR